ncbi:tetratricopeptide repeat protein [Methyloversatilis universalis]|uniref:tetratricopeptide repeat protein n=1 Tax=Methyloversatilis universalis TaxID=378211 RepID=UPI000375E33D|nr:tetratricopeptide repeat protein [Methyloversatilis universalis]
MTVTTRRSSLLQGARSCPYCLSTNTKDSSWKSSDEKAGRFWLKPVRCRNCHKRFVRFRRLPLALVGGALAAGLASAVVVTFRGVDTRSQSEHEKLIAELEPMEAERARAHTGDPEAQYSFGMMLSQGGTGKAEDLAESIRWLERAAEQGHVRAQYELGLAYKLGRGTLQDYAAAGKWFTSAARNGHVGAQYHMGRLHRIGEGVPADLVRAYAWFNRAAAQGHGAARGARDEIAASLKPEQLAQAQELSRASSMPDVEQPLPPAARKGAEKAAAERMAEAPVDAGEKKAGAQPALLR